MKGLVLEMKDESGKLAWMSGVATASSNAANSTWDPTAYLSELKAQGWTITAEICCAVDTLLASANPDVALRDRTGAPYVDESGGWVDLWNRDVRTYIEELCTDLMAMAWMRSSSPVWSIRSPRSCTRAKLPPVSTARRSA